ncbi:MAG: tRNA epoxyqueuosine(34) reductase QueG [Gemmataceae bacterium]
MPAKCRTWNAIVRHDGIPSRYCRPCEPWSCWRCAYHPSIPPKQSPVRVASYAQGDDYHDVLRARLNALLDRLRQSDPSLEGRGVVDTAPLLERDFARRAGLGWVGKNTMLIDKRLGSWFFLAGLLLNRDFPEDRPFDAQHCGTCTRCLDACPTDAFVSPGVLDARRCISYLTIELRGPIPMPLREGMGEWIFGCDICQEVCPWNRKATAGAETAFSPRAVWDTLDPLDLLYITDEEFRKRFRGTALFRPNDQGLLQCRYRPGESKAPGSVVGFGKADRRS